MNEPEAVEFVLAGSVAGKTVSATKGVPFTRFIEFNDDVQKYVQGSENRTVLHELSVQVEDGSLLLRVLIPAGILTSLIADTAKVAQAGSLSDVDPVRARVLSRWQERAKTEPELKYAVRSPRGAFAPVEITKDTVIKREERTQWVDVERYLVGEITDWGGAQTSNVHLRPRNSRETIIVAAKPDQIRGQRENLVYHKAIVQVRAKQNPKTGEVDKNSYKLVELRAYRPEVEENRLEQLFERGAKAWADVPEGGDWVEELRGGAHG
jgi:hypothetical protein